MAKPKKRRGRPPRPMPERIDASPEELVKAMFSLPVDHDWWYIEKESPVTVPVVEPARVANGE